jgi:hypothetical protein
MQQFSPEPLAVDIATAARMVGISRAQFYRLYLTPGRVRAIKTGGRDRVIDVAELRGAYAALVADLRASEAA